MKKRFMSILLILWIMLPLLPITVTAAAASLIDADITYPTKTDYQFGDPFDTTGFKVVMKSNDGEILDITGDILLRREDGKRIKHGDPLSFAKGDVKIKLEYANIPLGTYTIIITGTATSNDTSTSTGTSTPAGSVINPKDWPFVPSDEKGILSGMVKTGWKYIIANDMSKFRIWEDGVVRPSMRYNYAFYFEHLGNNKYYIRSPYGGYLSYEGKAREGAQIVISDKPCKWMLQSDYIKPAVYYYISPDEDHNYTLYSSGFNVNTEFNNVTLTKYRWGNIKQRFDISSTVAEQSIPQWWFDLRDGKPAPKGDPRDLDAGDEDEYMYYDKQAFAEETKLPAKGEGHTFNVEIPDYEINYYPKFGTLARSILLEKNKRGTYLKAYADGDYVTITKYSAKGEVKGATAVRYELPLFGAVYSGKQYNYIAFGNKDTGESGNKENVRIVKYDKEWKRISSVSVSSGKTKAVAPFRATSARFAENGNQLILYTGRLRFKSGDGINHQSNLTISVDTSTMKVTSVSSLFPANHVSHSFDAYVRFDGGTAVFLDLGDASPRSLILQKASGGGFKKATIYDIKGPKGANYTGVTVGGLEVSSKNYLTVLATINQSAAKWGKANSDPVKNGGMNPTNEDSLRRDLVLCVIPRSLNSGTKTVMLGEYSKSSKTALAPKLLKISDNKFAVLWGEYSGKIVSDFWSDEDWEEEPDDFDRIVIDRYLVQYLDGNGKKLGKVKQYKKLDDVFTEYYKEVEKGK